MYYFHRHSFNHASNFHLHNSSDRYRRVIFPGVDTGSHNCCKNNISHIRDGPDVRCLEFTRRVRNSLQTVLTSISGIDTCDGILETVSTSLPIGRVVLKKFTI